jgi:hypothetical protein
MFYLVGPRLIYGIVGEGKEVNLEINKFYRQVTNVEYYLT